MKHVGLYGLFAVNLILRWKQEGPRRCYWDEDGSTIRQKMLTVQYSRNILLESKPSVTTFFSDFKPSDGCCLLLSPTVSRSFHPIRWQVLRIFSVFPVPGSKDTHFPHYYEYLNAIWLQNTISMGDFCKEPLGIFHYSVAYLRDDQFDEVCLLAKLWMWQTHWERSRQFRHFRSAIKESPHIKLWVFGISAKRQRGVCNSEALLLLLQRFKRTEA